MVLCNTLKASANPQLNSAAEVFERYTVANSDEAKFALLGELYTAIGNIGIGCAAVGVPLPADMLTINQSS